MGAALAAPVMFPAPAPSYSARTLSTPPLYSIDQVPCLWYPALRPAAHILYLHANGTDLGIECAVAQRMARQTGCDVLAPEYPGYGALCGESVSPEGAVVNALRCYRYLLRHATRPVIIVGRSIGSGVAAQLAARLADPPAGLVLISPFTSIAAMAPSVVPRMLLWGLYDTEAVVARCPTPLVVIHGDRDTLIAPAHGAAVVAASIASHKRLLRLPTSTHNELDWQAIHGAIVQLAGHVGLQGHPVARDAPS